MRRYIVTLTCPLPRIGFGTGDNHVEDYLKQMDDYLSIAKGDIVVFPEGYMKTNDLDEVINLAKKYHKWIVVGSEDDPPFKSLYTLLISPDGLLHQHCKTSLTNGDRKNGARQGNEIKVIDTIFGKIGLILCYEMHFPEVARILGILGAQIMFNTIGTGMWHEQQLYEWTSLAKARAIENRCFVLGCTHYCDPIPMMYGYDPHGRELVLMKNHEGIVDIEIDLDLIDERDYFNDRNPKAYTIITKEEL